MMSVGATGPCYTSSVYVTTRQSSIYDACALAPGHGAITLYSTAYETWTDSSCSTTASDGYYGDASTSKYYVVSSNTLSGPFSCSSPTTTSTTTHAPPTIAPTTTTIAPTAAPTTTTAAPCYSATYFVSAVQGSVAAACGAAGAITLYVNGPETYTNSNCSTTAADGYYGAGSGSYFVVSGNVLSGPFSCAPPTTSAPTPTTTIAPI